MGDFPATGVSLGEGRVNRGSLAWQDDGHGSVAEEETCGNFGTIRQLISFFSCYVMLCYVVLLCYVMLCFVTLFCHVLL